MLAEKGASGGGGISYPVGRSILYLIRGCSAQGYPTHMRLLDPRMPGTPPVQRLYLKGATGASHHRGGSISQGSEHRLEGHPFEAAYMEPRVCAYGFRGHLDPNMGDPEHPIIGPPRSQGRVHVPRAIQGPTFCTCTVHILAGRAVAHAWWLAAFDRTWGPGCLVDEPLMSAARGPPLVQVERDCDSGVSCGLLGRMHNMHRGPPDLNKHVGPLCMCV